MDERLVIGSRYAETSGLHRKAKTVTLTASRVLAGLFIFCCAFLSFCSVLIFIQCTPVYFSWHPLADPGITKTLS